MKYLRFMFVKLPEMMILGRDFPVREQRAGRYFVYSLYHRIFTLLHCGLRSLISVFLALWSVNALADGSRKPRLIVSMATVRERVASVPVALESLLSQSLKADKVVLWLPEDAGRPTWHMRLLQRRGLEIVRTAGTTSHRKLLCALKRWPEDLLVTVDDDLIYPSTTLEDLYSAWQNDHRYIYTHLARCIVRDGAGFAEYDRWPVDRIVETGINNGEAGPLEAVNRASGRQDHLSTLARQAACAGYNLLPLSGSGTLFPPGSLHRDIFDEEAIMQLCATTDDLWYHAMALRQKTRIKRLYLPPRAIQTIPNTQGSTHWQTNSRGVNLKNFRKLLDKYDLWKLLN